MIYLSVCSGIEAATQAWHPLGWEPVAFSEIERFPSAVLAYHYPNVPNWGDMARCKEWPDAEVDVLVGGTPCQSFSIAGLRKGLDDPRGNLALTYLAIAERYRPEWLVWENVPGVLSADGGCAFGAIVGGMVELGYCPAWRVLDAQHVRTQRFLHAVPQRRRRVFVVAHLGDWRRAAAVLFDSESLRGNPAPRRETGQGVAARAGSGAAVSSGHGWWDESDVAATVRAQDSVTKADTLIPQGVAIRGREGGGTAELTGNVATALRASQGGGDKPHVMAPPAANPLGSMDNGMAVAFSAVPMNSGKDYTVRPTEVAQPLTTVQAGNHNQGGDFVKSNMAVRRLTPAECERLQGFPDNFTRIPWRGKLAENCPDGPRYKALGNSMAVNCMEWLGERIQMIIEAEL